MGVFNKRFGEDVKLKVKEILGYRTVSGSGLDCLKSIEECLERADRSCRWMACINPHSYVLGKSDSEFSRSLRHADWLVPDGIGMILAGHILGCQLKERITGFSIFDGVMQDLDSRGGSVFFLGSCEQTLNIIEQKVSLDFPNIRLAGTFSPPFKEKFTRLEKRTMIAAITAANADVLWVGMTAPKQEKWIAELQPHLRVHFAGAIGAVFDFYSGKVRRSHAVFQTLGLEWLPRLLQEPRRLWRRTVFSAPIFLWDVILMKLSLKH